MKKSFILGNPRSGTSLLRLILNSHTKIASPPECGFMQWWFKKYKDWNKTCLIDRAVREFVQDVLSSKKIETWNLSESELYGTIINSQPSSYGELCECVYLQWSHSQGKDASLLVDKNNYYIKHLNTLDEIWPDAFYIHIVRDGRDVACSYIELDKLSTKSKYKPKLPTNILDIAQEWTDNNERIENFLMDKKSVRIRYEDLITRPEDALKIILAPVGENYERRMLSFYEISKEPNSTIDWKKKTNDKIDSSNMSKFLDRLDADDRRVFDEVAHKYLKRYRYIVN